MSDTNLNTTSNPGSAVALATPVSWRFYAALLTGFLLSLGLTFGAFQYSLGVPSITSRWAFEVMQKKREAAERAPSPKLLLVGGSGTLFGISARELQQQTGLRTVNLGCHAALGSAFMLYEARRSTRPGDTVLLVFEYELYRYGKLHRDWADTLLVDYIVARAPEYYQRLSPLEQWNVFMFTSNERLVDNLKHRHQPEPPHNEIKIYDVHELNDWGDQVHHTMTNKPPDRQYVLNSRATLASGVSRRSKEAFAVIEEFSRWAAANNVRVLATFPNLCDQPEYHGPKAARVVQHIKDSFARLNIPLLGDYTDGLKPADEFFDTYYHLTEEAAFRRTRLLAQQLRPFLRTGGKD